MPFENLPGIFDIRTDGNLAITPINENPIVLVLGTATQGDSWSLYTVNRVTDALRAYGRDGTLARGLLEAVAGGALNIRLFRIGATTALLVNAGADFTIETIQADDSAGTSFTLFWDDSAGRLRIFRESDGVVVWDNNPTYPALRIDTGEVVVSGDLTIGGATGDIGSEANPLTLAGADGVRGSVYTAGTDGLRLSRPEMFEALYDAYQLLENEDIDFVIPMDVYQDQRNVSDMVTADIPTWTLGNNYPTPEEEDTLGGGFLGRVFVEEYQGRNYFRWDMDRDNIAEIWPAGIPGSATTDSAGNALGAADFHEASFAYQLARFCFDQSQDNVEMMGFIGTRPPDGLSLQAVREWIGTSPVTEVDVDTGNEVIVTNGTGLLGNKWHAGRLSNLATGLLGHVINLVDGLSGGGYIATGTIWPDGIQETDRNDQLVDIGKYISVAPAQMTIATSLQNTAYMASGAAYYAGFVAARPSSSAPTNKVLPGLRLPFRISLSNLDALAGAGYVMFQRKPKGVVCADAPTASRSSSDYRRLSTMLIVKDTLDAIRTVADPFLGNSLKGAKLAALETAIEAALSKLQSVSGILQRYEFTITSTATDHVQGRAAVELKLVPAFELRRITVNVSLAAA